MNSFDDDIWKIQYENLVKLLSDEASRFWTRFQVFLAVNGGLLAVFPIVLGLYSGTLQELTVFTKSMLLGISIAGIIESALWLTITISGRETQNHYRNQAQKLEKLNPKVDFFIFESKKDRGKNPIISITVLSLGLPMLFVGVWAFILYIGFSTDFGMLN